MTGPARDDDARGRARADADEQPTVAVSRRSLLRTGVAIGTASGFAGCTDEFGVSQITSYSFAATPVVLASAREGPTYELETATEETIERRRTVVGTEVDVELTNHAAIYEGDVDTLGLLSSPTAEVATRKLNPLATDPLREILVGEAGEEIMRSLELTEGSEVQWIRGPELVESGEGELLGQSTGIEAYAGVTEGSGFVLVTAARVTDGGDVVIAANAQQRDGEAASLVGGDGYVTRETAAASVERLSAVLPRIERGGAGVRLVESTQLSTDGDAPNYVRVLLENQYEERTIYAVSLTTQFFDGEGAFLDAATASVPALGAEERFEGYVPYVTDEVAGYAVDAEHSNRRITTRSPDDVEVSADDRVGDTVTAAVENTGDEVVPHASLEVTFYGDDGTILGTRKRNVANLGEQESREYEVAFAPPTIDPSYSIDDYSVRVLEYGGSVAYVR